MAVDDVRKLLIIENLLPDGELVKERVIDNAGHYHNQLCLQSAVNSGIGID